MEAANTTLRDIPVDWIDPNPDNPRIVFRQEELDELLVSIKTYGVQVPITVYKEGRRYILIDGERRWRTCKKLNMDSIPAIVQGKPTPLENLLMMFNIHSLREQWDLFTIANKLTKIIELLSVERKRTPTEIELSAETGLNRATIRRCHTLINLPSKYKRMILKELERPKAKQRLTEDFFIEMENALRTVKRNFPRLMSDPDRVRDTLIEKFQNATIENMVDFRMIGKLATSPKNVSYPIDKAEAGLRKVLLEKKLGIEDVFNTTVGVLYDEKRLISSFNNVLVYIQGMTEEERNDEEIRQTLIRIKGAIEQIISTD